MNKTLCWTETNPNVFYTVKFENNEAGFVMTHSSITALKRYLGNCTDVIFDIGSDIYNNYFQNNGITIYDVIPLDEIISLKKQHLTLLGIHYYRDSKLAEVLN